MAELKITIDYKAFLQGMLYGSIPILMSAGYFYWICNRNKAPTRERYLHVREPWLFFIQERLKTIEGRAGPRNKFEHLLGETFVLYNEYRKVTVRFNGIKHYTTLHDYVTTEGWEKVAPHAKSFEDAIAKYREIYTDDHIAEKGGINALSLEVLD